METQILRTIGKWKVIVYKDEGKKEVCVRTPTGTDVETCLYPSNSMGLPKEVYKSARYWGNKLDSNREWWE